MPKKRVIVGTPLSIATAAVLVVGSIPKTGIFFNRYDYKELSKILKKFNSKIYTIDNCRKQAANFAVPIFQYKLKTYVEDILKENING